VLLRIEHLNRRAHFYCDLRSRAGSGESGKSTLFKQMIKLYGDGFQQKDLLMYVPMIHNNTIASMKVRLLLMLRICAPCLASTSLYHGFTSCRNYARKQVD